MNNFGEHFDIDVVNIPSIPLDFTNADYNISFTPSDLDF